MNAHRMTGNETFWFSTRPTPMTKLARAVLCASLALFAALHVYAQRGPNGPGTGKPDDHLVPWKFVGKGAAVEKGALTLYWLPASEKEIEQSPLLTSRPLLEATLRCVAARIVLPENTATIESLGATGTLPTALLVNDQGTVIRRIVDRRPVLPSASVEWMVKEELAARDEAMYKEMSEARKLAGTNKDRAIDLYKKVWNDRCFFPMAGTEAQRALKALGVVVVDVPAPSAVDPQLKPPALKPKSN